MRFRFEFLDERHIVMLHGAVPPPVDGWRDYLLQIRDRDLTSMGLLSFTNGGAPDATQRQELNQVIGGRYYARAIVHRSTLVRGVVMAVSWFAPGVKAFSPWAWPAAAEHAHFKPDDLMNLASQVKRLHAGMTEKIPWLDRALDQRDSFAPPDDVSSPTADVDGSIKRPSLTPRRVQLDTFKGR